MTRRPKTALESLGRKRVLVAHGLLALCAWAGGAGAQDEVTEPAGELPQEGDSADGGLPPVGDEGQAPGSSPGVAGAKAGKKAKSEKDDEDGQESWDSFPDPASNASVAQEITGGVRVEDIVEPPTDYRYAAFGKPDPFVPPMVTEEKNDVTAGPLEIPIVSPLQKYRLSELRLVGIWQLRTGERKAMIMAPASAGSRGGQGIIVKNGDPVGNRGGRILAIGDAYVTVREFTLAPDGTRQFEDQQMYMGERPQDDLAGKIRFKPGEKNPQVLLEGGADAGDQVQGTPAGSAPPARQGAARGATQGGMQGGAETNGGMSEVMSDGMNGQGDGMAPGGMPPGVVGAAMPGAEAYAPVTGGPVAGAMPTEGPAITAPASDATGLGSGAAPMPAPAGAPVPAAGQQVF